MHCVWRFLIPAKTYLLLEIFDFDVFESISENPNAWDGDFPFPRNTDKGSSPSEDTSEFSSTAFPAKAWVPHDLDSKDLHDGFPETTSQNVEWEESRPRGEPKELAVTQPSKFPIHGGTNDTLMRHMSGGKQEEEDSADKIFSTRQPAEEKAEGPQKHLGKVIFGEEVAISTAILPAHISFTPLFSADVCPDDVLYVSDLTAFSSRFCGTKSPLNKNMTFGSPLKMVEVIVELITTTDRGRGFAMLFEYQSGAETITTGNVKDGEENTMILVIITGILFFALVLLSSLCIACRWRLCFKTSSLEAHSDQENQISNAGVDVSELQLVIPCQENVNNNHSAGGNGIVTSCPGNLEPITDLDASSASAVMGSDEVFVNSANPELGFLSFTSCKIKGKTLKRSVTSPTSVSEWLIPKQMEPGSAAPTSQGEHPRGAPPKQQTWRAQTFHDLLAPFPKLQEQGCSWTTSDPFAKLGKSRGPSAPSPNQPTSPRNVTSTGETEGIPELTQLEGLAGRASSPLKPSAQQWRKLSEGSHLRRSRLANPSLGFLTAPPGRPHRRLPEHFQVKGTLSLVESLRLGGKGALEVPLRWKSSLNNGSKSQEASSDVDEPRPAFVISEEGDDQQPLVLAEHSSRYVDVLPESTCDGGTAAKQQRRVASPLQEGSDESTSTTLGLHLWGDRSGDFQGDRNETYAPGAHRKPESVACPKMRF